MQDKRTREQVTREMAELVERTKATGALRYAIMEESLRVACHWGDRVLKMWQERLDDALALLEDNPEKQEKIERAKERVSDNTGSQQQLEGTLAFLKEVEQGIVPEDWRERPSWSLSYPYEGIYCHNVIRHGATMQRWERDNGGQPLTDEQLKAKLLEPYSHSQTENILARFVREEEEGK